jgi:hypothetical protein
VGDNPAFAAKIQDVLIAGFWGVEIEKNAEIK